MNSLIVRGWFSSARDMDAGYIYKTVETLSRPIMSRAPGAYSRPLVISKLSRGTLCCTRAQPDRMMSWVTQGGL